MASPSETDPILLARVVERPVAERAAYLASLCGQDSARRRRLEELLAAHDGPASLGEAPRPDPDTAGACPDGELGAMLGRYRLPEPIGEGGCGVVYVAEQLEPVRRHVAL